MRLIIDPDVFVESFGCDSCSAALNELNMHFETHCFYWDDEEILEAEYRRIFNDHYGEQEEHPAILLLQYLLEDSSQSQENMLPIDNMYRTKITSMPHSEAVEPEMLGMLFLAQDLGLQLMLIGHHSGLKARYRVLHSEQDFRLISKDIPWLDVLWAAQSQLLIPNSTSQSINDHHPKTKEFELQTALWLQTQYPDLKCIIPPPKGSIGEQIDVYGYRNMPNGEVALVGECKLRGPGNENLKPIEAGEIQQLRRKLIAAQLYEETRSGQIPDGIFVTNAAQIDEPALELLMQEEIFRIIVINMKLQKKWETKQDWRILEQHQLYPQTTDETPCHE
ncbi:MAG: hypothetical protein H6642_15255 [Caldilineaceae bacterium]|nr:hypothetical protein [Caldilineaceae bacterium]